VRIEIAQGVTFEEVDRALITLRSILKRHWAYAANPIGALAMARELERCDFSRGTIDGQTAVSEACFVPAKTDASNAG
jgi:hypothetical protein